MSYGDTVKTVKKKQKTKSTHDIRKQSDAFFFFAHN